MFSLIITIISIALVAALAVASLYYGGSAFSQGTARANAATLVAQAQQIAAANTLYANDHNGVFADAVGDLVTGNYLSAVPQVKVELRDPDDTTGWALATGNVVELDINDEATEVINKIMEQAGQTVTAAPDINTAGTQFGVYTDASRGAVFFFKG